LQLKAAHILGRINVAANKLNRVEMNRGLYCMLKNSSFGIKGFKYRKGKGEYCGPCNLLTITMNKLYLKILMVFTSTRNVST
jgi:hypothetical protein